MDGDEKTPVGLLAQVDSAIETILLGGQSYKLGTRAMTHADLGILRQMRTELEAQAGAETRDGLLTGGYVAYFEGR